MDHREFGKRIGDLEDDLDYNIGRKEDLKAEVRKLEKQNKEIRELNWKNATAQMETERELGELKLRFDLLEKENSELRSVNNEVKLEDIKFENKMLEENILNLKNYNFKRIATLEAEIKRHRSQIQSLLKCDKNLES